MQSQDIELSPLERALIAVTSAMYDPALANILSKEELRDMMSSGQILSKKWLLKKIMWADLKLAAKYARPTIGGHRALVCGGWVGQLAHAINGVGYPCDSLDIDARLQPFAARVLGDVSADAVTGDMLTFDYTGYDTVVNTSMEHIEDPKGWVSRLLPNTMVVAQSNNARGIDGHVNCVDSAYELETQLGLREVVYSDELVFPMYTRYMVIGIV